MYYARYHEKTRELFVKTKDRRYLKEYKMQITVWLSFLFYIPMEQNTSFMHTFWKFVGEAEVELDKIFGKKAPALPQGGRELTAQILPWLAVISIIFMVPSLLLALGLSALLAPFSLVFNTFSASTSYFGLFISAIFSIINIVLICLAIPGLFKRTKTAWNYIFVCQLLGVIQNILMFSILGLIIGCGIGFYILFQIRPLYLGIKPGHAAATPAASTVHHDTPEKSAE